VREVFPCVGSGCHRRLRDPVSAPLPRVTPGRVLPYAAEDALHIVRRRLEGICAAVGRELPKLAIQVITAPTVRLDLPADYRRLQRTVEQLKPRLLILDPFVRLHRIDENASGEVAPLLAYLRELQRRYELAVLLVHHAKKGGGRMRAGQALRGSSEFPAWGDSNFYLRRSGSELTLTVEHRAAPSMPPVALDLAQRGESLALELCTAASTPQVPPPSSIGERILSALANSDRPMPITELRTVCRIRNATLRERLIALTRNGQILRDDQGYSLARSNSTLTAATS